VTFAWIEERKGEWPVAQLCRVPEVSRSGFYAWRSRGPSPAEVRREELAEQITTIHAEVRGRYGSPRVHAELVAGGTPCCVNTVARVMREAGIAAKTKRKFRQTTDSDHALPVADRLGGARRLTRRAASPSPSRACGRRVRRHAVRPGLLTTPTGSLTPTRPNWTR